MKKIVLLALSVMVLSLQAIAQQIPANPTADEWYDCGDESGFSRFYFTLPTTDVDGNQLNPEFISYSIFTDNDQLFTFDAESYTFDLESDITEVPYSLYTNAVDFHDYFVYLYRTNEEGYEPLFNERIGIQAYYTVDGVRTASHIVYWPDGETMTALGKLNADKQVATTTYYDLSGRRLTQPVSGVNVMVTRYTDGTSATTKVVK